MKNKRQRTRKRESENDRKLKNKRKQTNEGNSHGMPCCKLLEIKRPVPTCTASRWSKHARLSGADNTSDPGNTVTLPGGCKCGFLYY